MEKIPLSANRVGMATRCPYQLKLYQEFGPVPPSIVLIQGGAAHASYETHYKHVIDGSPGFSVSQAQEFFANELKQRCEKEQVIFDAMPFSGALDQGVQLVEAYMRGIAPQVRPSSVEAAFAIELQDFNIRGYIDLLEQDGSLRDTKHKARAPSQADVDHDWQLSIYDLAREMMGLPPSPEISLDVVVKKKKPEAVRIRTNRTATQRNQTMGLIRRVCAMVQSDAYVPNTNGWWCGEKWCGWWKLCPFGGGFGQEGCGM